MQETVRQYFDRKTCTYTYLIYDQEEAVIVDPVWENKELYVQELEELGLKLRLALDTHIHADHVTCLSWLEENTGCETYNPGLRDDDQLWDGRLNVLLTPGHTKESKCFVLRRNCVFTGDTLLIRKCGRVDFQGGSAEQQYSSIKILYNELPDNMIVYPGHEYSGRTQSTIGEEKKHNIRCNSNTARKEFIRTMNELKLTPPKNLERNVRYNRNGGVGYSGDEND